jgi:hypothetical protein
MKLGSDTGSLINHVIAGSNMPEPKVGMGATVLSWTDRYAATIIEVKGKRVVVQYDDAIRTDSNGMSESQSYRYEPNPNAEKMIFSLRKNGQYKLVGGGKVLAVGERRHYHDYSF